MAEENKNALQTTFSSIPETIVRIIKDPAEFFRTMPKTGGFIDPLIFLAVLSTASALIQALFALVGLSFSVSVGMAVASLVIVPVLAAVFSFVGALVAFIIWRLMGSSESYETAYRCCAYGTAIYPLTTVLNLVPYLGPIAAAAWMAYLAVMASVEAHKVKQQTAWIVFGILCALMAVSSISSRIAARRISRSMKNFEQRTGMAMEEMEDMSPEEAGRAMGQFFKGMSQAAQEMEAEEQAAAAQE